MARKPAVKAASASAKKRSRAPSGRIGLNCALSTPFTETGHIDVKRMVAHARWVLDNGCDGITVFGTTGEGASIGIGGRHQALAALEAAGLDMRGQVIAGVSAASVHDAVEQARAAYSANCRGLLMAPPFYFGGASDDGLFAYFASVFRGLGPQLRDVILYHIPGMTRNGISVDLTKRLMTAFPGVIIGVKDSNGDWAATEQRLKELKGLQVLVGDERQLARAVRAGGAGTICGLANVAPDLLGPLAREGRDDPKVTAMVEAILSYSFMSAIKALISARTNDAGWRIMRPPLDPLSAAQTRKLAAAIAAVRSAKMKAA